jgi:hypothetical protein
MSLDNTLSHHDLMMREEYTLGAYNGYLREYFQQLFPFAWTAKAVRRVSNGYY